jgi:DNA primase
MPPTGQTPEEIRNAIRQQTDIVAVIGEYVHLEQTGKNYKGLCPFHQEKTPSFVVDPQKQFFHCYGCGVGGDVFTFLMQYEKYSFPEALRFLAQKLGFALPSKASGQSSQDLRRTDLLYRLHQDVAQFFKRQLHEHPQAQPARDYLKNRGITEQIIETFALGYAPADWDSLLKAFRGKYPPEVLLESGLIIPRKSGKGHYDRFRERVMIPIADERGRIIGFGGRIMGTGEPKYLNSPESPIFHKGQVLFGFHQSKEAVRREKTILIVEGYFDMIVPYSYGVQPIAATMGTALTDQHLRVLQRYTPKVILVFDPDPAGIKAVQRTLDLFLESGFDVRAAILPHGDDPDTAVRKMGAEQFRHYVNQAPLLLDFIRARVLEQYNLAQVDQRIACANQLLATIIKIKNIPERNDQIMKTAALLNITEADEALFAEFKKVARTGKPVIAKQVATKPVSFPPLERFLIKALMKDKSQIALVQQMLNPTELSHPVAQRILKELLIYGDKTDAEAKILDIFRGTAYQNYLAQLFMQLEEIIDPAATVQDCVKRLHQKGFEQNTLTSTRKLREAQQQRDDKPGVDAMFEQKIAETEKKRPQNWRTHSPVRFSRKS